MTYTTTILGVQPDPEFIRYHNVCADQVQIDVDRRTKLHLDGDPAAWRVLAKAIEDAAIEAEWCEADEQPKTWIQDMVDHCEQENGPDHPMTRALRADRDFIHANPLGES